MAHREGIREYLKDVQVHGLVIDWGCGTKPIKNYLKPNDARFIGIDKLDHVGADIVLDFEAQPFGMTEREEQADFAFCIEVLEHVWNSKQMMLGIWSCLKEGGILYLSQPYHYATHKDDDRVRYTHHGLRQLLEEAGFIVEDMQPTVGELDHAEGYIVRARK